MKPSDIQLNPESNITGTEYSILDFWKWGFSNILTNSLRGIFAEFLVGTAIGPMAQTRIEWDAYDLRFNNLKIEVKSSAYIQSWHNGKHSNINFTIGLKKEYDYSTNKYSVEAGETQTYMTSVLLKEKDPEKVNPLNTEQWEFYVALTEVLNDKFLLQKSLSLSSLQKFCKPVTYKELKDIFTN